MDRSVPRSFSRLFSCSYAPSLSRLFAAFTGCVLAFSAAAQLPVPTTPAVEARAWLLLDFNSGQVLASQKADERFEPASLTKLMTAYLSFSALKQKTLKLDQVIPVSTRAWKSEGSRMFIEPNKPVIVEDLLRGMIIDRKSVV